MVVVVVVIVGVGVGVGVCDADGTGCVLHTTDDCPETTRSYHIPSL